MHAFVYVPGGLMVACSTTFFVYDYWQHDVKHFKWRVALCMSAWSLLLSAAVSTDSSVLLVSIMMCAASFLANGLSVAIYLDSEVSDLHKKLLQNQAV